MYYYLIIAFQFYCLYHAYKNSKSYFWFIIIFFLPLIGCIVYLITQVINKKDVEVLSDEITTIINPTKKVKDSQKQLDFSDTFQNRVNLADAFKEINDFKNASIHYQKALTNYSFKKDPHTINKLIICCYNLKDYKKVIEYAAKIELDHEFAISNFYLGLALEKEQRIEEAKISLQKIDRRFSNYNERVEFANFFIRQQKNEKAREILNEILDEINSLKAKTNQHKFINKEAKKILNEL